MKALAYHHFGTTEVLQIVEQTRPVIKPDEVLVKVKAFSINPMDWKIRKGEMKLLSGSKFPKLTAADFSGTIAEAGAASGNFRIGDEVFGVVKNMMKDGASAEYVAVPAVLVWKKPVKLSFEQAAAIPVVGTAAMTAISKMGKINSRTQILVNGATGGFGMFLLQLMQQRGANITAVTSTKGIEPAKQWGAQTVIDYTREDVLSQQTTYDIVIDLSGKMGYTNAKRIMKPKSRYLNPSPRPIEIPLSILKNVFTGKKHRIVLASPATEHTQALLRAVDQGLNIEINKVFPFSQFKQAYQYAEEGGYTGKVVVTIDQPI